MSVQELEEYFTSLSIPDKIKLGQAVQIEDVPLFIDSHLTVIKQYPNSKSFKSFYDRLVKLKELLEQKG